MRLLLPDIPPNVFGFERVWESTNTPDLLESFLKAIINLLPGHAPACFSGAIIIGHGGCVI